MLLPLLLAFVVPVSHAQPQIPTWKLEQNVPNPFCPLQGPTSVFFEMPKPAHVLLRVWSPDSTTVIRTFVDGDQEAGRHHITWDGKDDFGVPLEDGDYPCTMTAGGSPAEFDTSMRATIDCVAAGVGESGTQESGPRLVLSAPVPNPLAPGRGATHLSLFLREPAAVGVAVYDASGRVARRLLRPGTALAAGRHELTWDGRTDSGKPAAGGIYWVRVSAAGESARRTVILLR